jgi:hypothetical protein
MALRHRNRQVNVKTNFDRLIYTQEKGTRLEKINLLRILGVSINDKADSERIDKKMAKCLAEYAVEKAVLDEARMARNARKRQRKRRS